MIAIRPLCILRWRRILHVFFYDSWSPIFWFKHHCCMYREHQIWSKIKHNLITIPFLNFNTKNKYIYDLFQYLGMNLVGFAQQASGTHYLCPEKQLKSLTQARLKWNLPVFIIKSACKTCINCMSFVLPIKYFGPALGRFGPLLFNGSSMSFMQFSTDENKLKSVRAGEP